MMTNVTYGKLTAKLIGAWFLLSLSASALKIFENSSARPPLPLGLAVLTPFVLFALWYAASAGFRQFALTLNPRTLTIVQAWRIGGFVFLILHAHGILPGIFALPAGWGDIAIGATAPLVAMKLVHSDHRKGFILWQTLGMLDLVMAVSLGVLAGLIFPDGITTGAMTVLPLSLIPTFAVPLLIILHVICIAQARRWPERKYSRADVQPASSEA
jgi:hypothetical protein